MRIGAMGKTYEDGQCIVNQGDVGNEMYVVQQGKVDVVIDGGTSGGVGGKTSGGGLGTSGGGLGSGGEIKLSTFGVGEVFGEMALFTKEPRSATVRACGKARVLTIDKRGFFKRVHQDPSLAFQILRKMSQRMQELNKQIVELKGKCS